MLYSHASFPGQNYSMHTDKIINEMKIEEGKSATWYMLYKQELENFEKKSWQFGDRKTFDDALLSKKFRIINTYLCIFHRNSS